MPDAALTHILTGQTVPLTPAPMTLEGWRPACPPEVLAPAHPESPLHWYHEAQGYCFAWGHFLEHVVPPEAESPGLLLWDVILVEAQQAYQAGGGNLEELTDMTLLFLDASMPRHAPRWLQYDEGARPAACAFLAPTAHGCAARRWLRTFLHRGMPLLRALVHAVNAAAWREAPSVEARGVSADNVPRPA